jgi:hypothetical protein
MVTMRLAVMRVDCCPILKVKAALAEQGACGAEHVGGDFDDRDVVVALMDFVVHEFLDVIDAAIEHPAVQCRRDRSTRSGR